MPDVETRRGASLPRGDLYAVGYTRGFVRGGIIYIIIRVRNGRDYELRNSSALTTFIPSSLISDAMVSMVITYLG